VTRTALVSDVHGNATALRAVLDELDRDGIEHVVCLGDLLYGGPQPVECLELVLDRRWPVVLGNADAFVLDPATAEGSPEPVTPQQLDVRAWAHERLSREQLHVVASWPCSIEVDLGHGRRLLAFHATPGSYHPLLLPAMAESEFRAALGRVDADVCAGGHTHLQFVRRVGGSTFVNPGSVGFGYDHEQDEEGFTLDGWASYAVLTTSSSGLRVELRRVAFDPSTVASALRSVGYPHAEARAAMWDRAGTGPRRDGGSRRQSG